MALKLICVGEHKGQTIKKFSDVLNITLTFGLVDTLLIGIVNIAS